MSKLLIKQISILSSIFGAFLGVLTLIPVIRTLSFLVVIILLAPVVMIYLRKLNFMGKFTAQDGMIYGAIAGFVSGVAFLLLFIPLDLLFGLFIKNGFISWIASMIKGGGLFFNLMMIFLLGLMNALTNSFSGLATAFLYDFLEKMKD